jgi:hypothetical protein
MANENSEIQPAPPPKCPHCGADMPRVNQFSWAGSSWLILAVYCEACLTLLKMAIVPTLPPDANEPPRIARPS